MQEWQKTQEMMINKIVVERAKTIDDAIFGEIQEIATESGIETKILISKEAVANALRKQIPKKANISIKGTTDYNTSVHCPTCHKMLTGIKPHYCSECGQALDWGNEK